MRGIEGETVDLISPFPANQVSRLWSWLHSFKTTNFADGSPQSLEEFIPWTLTRLMNVLSYGVIDKNNILNMKHEVPMIGFIAIEPATAETAYYHVASTRRAHGKGLLSEATQLAIRDVFDQIPPLLRIGAAIVPWNKKARTFVEQEGFQYEGRIRHAALQKGKPIDIVHYGLTREAWGGVTECPGSYQ